MNKYVRLAIAIVATLILGFGIYYFWLPAINLQSQEFWIFILSIILLFGLFFGVLRKSDTVLVEGKDIVRIVGSNLHLTNDKGAQYEIINASSSVVARIWYNWAGNKNVSSNTAIIFKTPLDCTLTCQVYKAKLTPTPGKVDSTQVPKTVNG